MTRFEFIVFSLIFVLVYISSPCSALSSTTIATPPTTELTIMSKATSAALDGKKPPPIVYTIAGSDSGGGAGIQADLHAIHSMGCHGCSAITCLTAQNSVGVTAVHTPPIDFLQAQLDALVDDLPPIAIKIGMLGNDPETAKTIGRTLQRIKDNLDDGDKVWVVLDPVMISTSGHKLINDEAKESMIQHVCRHADVITPNKFEAEAFLGRKLLTTTDVETGAKELLQSFGCKAVLIKGGHTLLETQSSSTSTKEMDEMTPSTTNEVQATLQYAQDYLLASAEFADPEGEERLCDGSKGVWIRSTRWDAENTHGTGCTLSSSIASVLALGEQKRRRLRTISNESEEGATSAIGVVDACCLAKAYVAAGIQQGVQLGQGPGPVAQTEFPESHKNYPSIVIDPTAVQTQATSFRPMAAYRDRNLADASTPVLGRILPIVDTVEWVERLSKTPGVADIQLRIKDKAILEDDNEENRTKKLRELVGKCQSLCQENGVRLWINDFWEAAIEAGCFGVHLGQEDLAKCQRAGGLDKLRNRNVALGISTHSYGELSVALGIQPSYVSMGPVFGTASKTVSFGAQGLNIVRKWRQLIPPNLSFVTIGGIGDTEAAKANRQAGADCVAVIGAVTKADDVPSTVAALNEAMN